VEEGCEEGARSHGKPDGFLSLDKGNFELAWEKKADKSESLSHTIKQLNRRPLTLTGCRTGDQTTLGRRAKRKGKRLDNDGTIIKEKK